VKDHRWYFISENRADFGVQRTSRRDGRCLVEPPIDNRLDVFEVGSTHA
jgi:hypothetical protein